MTLIHVIFSVLPFLLLCTSLWLIFKHILNQANIVQFLCLFLNGLLLFTLITMTTYSMAMDDLTAVPAALYWLLILSGIVIGILSFVVKYLPGQIMSAALLLFTAYVTLFSIGGLLLILFVIELVVIVRHFKQYHA